MINLLKIEWMKVKNYNAFIILSSFFALGVVTVNYVIFLVNKNMVSEAAGAGLVGKFSPYDFDKTWQTTSYASGLILILPALLIMMLITNEFAFKTHRQNIIDGWSRLEFIHVKIVAALIIAVVSTLLVFITALSFGFNESSAAISASALATI